MSLVGLRCTRPDDSAQLTFSGQPACGFLAQERAKSAMRTATLDPQAVELNAYKRQLRSLPIFGQGGSLAETAHRKLLLRNGSRMRGLVGSSWLLKGIPAYYQ